MFFHAVKPCVTYPIGQREIYHSRVEIGLQRDWTLGFDEPSRHWGNRKLMMSHHMEGGILLDPARDAHVFRGQSIYTLYQAP